MHDLERIFESPVIFHPVLEFIFPLRWDHITSYVPLNRRKLGTGGRIKGYKKLAKHNHKLSFFKASRKHLKIYTIKG